MTDPKDCIPLTILTDDKINLTTKNQNLNKINDINTENNKKDSKTNQTRNRSQSKTNKKSKIIKDKPLSSNVKPLVEESVPKLSNDQIQELKVHQIDIIE